MRYFKATFSNGMTILRETKDHPYLTAWVGVDQQEYETREVDTSYTWDGVFHKASQMRDFPTGRKSAEPRFGATGFSSSLNPPQYLVRSGEYQGMSSNDRAAARVVAAAWNLYRSTEVVPAIEITGQEYRQLKAKEKTERRIAHPLHYV